ncbi:uncharacterized protein ATNIH1004_008240 [Aspergillus tanneri]|uniref:Uncharacterized protein n=1 Tax=Aspergillus tanneri TaxID=1220188 RepID=A0A5M9MGE3_9EURO|nr:uncharacterized protein ATNIH1004_008240 [Aspergillus tanneri]KAA8644043.1 hypothetical protein ATNIH1004_008240 [Aspergillus tanneri]
MSNATKPPGDFSSTSSSTPSPLREVTLLCCLLFVLLDMLQGHRNYAFGHLQSGAQMLKCPRPRHSSLAGLRDRHRSRSTNDPLCASTIGGIAPLLRLGSIFEAKQELAVIRSAVFRFQSYAWARRMRTLLRIVGKQDAYGTFRYPSPAVI